MVNPRLLTSCTVISGDSFHKVCNITVLYIRLCTLAINFELLNHGSNSCSQQLANETT